jgi:hypothetical protein
VRRTAGHAAKTLVATKTKLYADCTIGRPFGEFCEVIENIESTTYVFSKRVLGSNPTTHRGDNALIAE